MRGRQAAILGAVLIGGAVLLLVRSDGQRISRTPDPAQDGVRLPQWARVERALDGDSVIISGGRQVRLIGIDAPEKGEPLADEAREWARSKLEGRWVRLEYDEETSDRYGRLLAYLWLENGGQEVLVNEEIVGQGLARSYPYPPNVRYRNRIARVERKAREARDGIWQADSAGDGPFVGSASRFHLPTCKHVSKIRKPVDLRTRNDAFEAGLSPCRSCKP
ncbi:MAG: thermonuclease family protein [Planctomycetota bacterium]|nr:thermonuclease family protein [Planctomycetota bacterium]